MRHDGEQTFDEAQIRFVIRDANLVPHSDGGRAMEEEMGALPARVQD